MKAFEVKHGQSNRINGLGKEPAIKQLTKDNEHLMPIGSGKKEKSLMKSDKIGNMRRNVAELCRHQEHVCWGHGKEPQHHGCRKRRTMWPQRGAEGREGSPSREQGAACGRAGHSPTVIIHGRGPRENLFDAPGGEKPSVCAVTGLERLETKCQ